MVVTEEDFLVFLSDKLEESKELGMVEIGLTFAMRRSEVENLVIALENRCQRKPIDNTGTNEYVEVWYQCPACNGDLTKIRSKCCPHCGQAIDWETDTTPDAEPPEWKDRMMKTFFGR